MSNIKENISVIRNEIEAVVVRDGRKVSDVCLVAVSKKQPEERIDAALDAGLRVFGENRVQEAYERWEERQKQYDDLELRLIGPLQSNKVRKALELFDVIETIDSVKLAEKVKRISDELERTPECYLQVNIGDEGQKSGVPANKAHAVFDEIHNGVGLKLSGIMCIPPAGEPAGLYFAAMRDLARKLGVKKISMGMSSDYQKAILCGATHIRVGSSLFGERDVA